tara:strand:- start:130 stop:447 length:318 start_codon:yes stop_codon:yes gene_type:complete
LWVDDTGLFVKVEEKGPQQGLIVRYTNVQFGELNEDTESIPVSFSADILDNPNDIDFDNPVDLPDSNDYLGNLVTCVVLENITQEDSFIEVAGTDDGQNRDTDTE